MGRLTWKRTGWVRMLTWICHQLYLDTIKTRVKVPVNSFLLQLTKSLKKSKARDIWLVGVSIRSRITRRLKTLVIGFQRSKALWRVILIRCLPQNLKKKICINPFPVWEALRVVYFRKSLCQKIMKKNLKMKCFNIAGVSRWKRYMIWKICTTSKNCKQWSILPISKKIETHFRYGTKCRFTTQNFLGMRWKTSESWRKRSRQTWKAISKTRLWVDKVKRS